MDNFDLIPDCSQFSFYSCLQFLLKTYKREEIFLRTNSSVGYPNREIEKIIYTQNGCEVFVNFLGLQGVSSNLPSYILDLLLHSQDEDRGWSLFFDFFNNHILWLFFDVISKKTYAKSINQQLQDSISKILFSILGYQGSVENAKTYLQFSPLIINRIRSKKYIQRILQEVFGLHKSLQILENIPHKTPISLSQRNSLGKFNSQLGRHLMLGKTSLTYQTKIGILIENLSYQQALEFFPSGRKYKILKEIIDFLTKNEFAIDLYLKINFTQEMMMSLGGGSAKLGWGCTLGSKNGDSLIVFALHE